MVIDTADEFERAAKEIGDLFKERGTKILKEAAASVRRERINCSKAREALSFFMSYWCDVVRPSLVSLACEAVGGDPSTAPFLGRSLTLLSGATDIHDDIIDKTITKGKRKTVNGGFGGDIALLVGDVLLFEGFAELFAGLARLKIPPEEKLAIVHSVKELYFEMCDGEALELDFRARTDVKPEEYISVVKKKAADVEACLRTGAMLGGGSPEQINALGEYGRTLGVIVLLRNDFEDMCGFDLLKSRIDYESLPLPLLFALENKEKREEILAALKNLDRKGAKKLLRLISEAGAINKLENLFMSLKEQADASINGFKWEVFKTILTATVPSKL
ncbi:MAG: polyprenyl synthetase family protein [Methanobacteriota archaeon]